METHRSSQLPEFNSIPKNKWMAGEGPIHRILNCVRPTEKSERYRNGVVSYIRQLIQNNVGGVEVLRYGSVPLKTYLPDGDIDLTVVSAPHSEHNVLSHVADVLRAERRHGGGLLTEIQSIDAKVKLIKCVVDGIIVDISFNQMSGLFALCFIDQVDVYIHKKHIFKRSIMLIKAWCYHESRIMGAVRGLISTYALETLVLYIFRMYDASLNSPLMVLYMFLQYYSKFDWSKYAVSMNGPVESSSLRFASNVMNIVDPLKADNNLGASVHLGTLFRIRMALDRGARTLRKILELPREKIPEEINIFFCNTLRMYRVRFNPERVADLTGRYEENERNLLTAQRKEGYPYTALLNYQINRAHGGSHEVASSSNANNGGHGLVHSPDTKLQFGSFDPDFITSIENIEPEPTDVRRRGKRVLNTPLPTPDSIKLSPLSTMINTLAYWFKH